MGEGLRRRAGDGCGVTTGRPRRGAARPFVTRSSGAVSERRPRAGPLRTGVGRVKASRPLVGFGVLIDNTIKGLTCLHEITSRNLFEKLVLNEMAYVLQASVIIPLA